MEDDSARQAVGRTSDSASKTGLRLCRCLPAISALLGLALFPIAGFAQMTHKGYFETNLAAYPQTAPGDSGQLVAEALLRYEPAFKLNSYLTFHGGFDARMDSHRQDERVLRLDYWDRSPQRPAFSVRQLGASYFRGPVTVDLGKQFIRWGKTDILNPTDRFAPRDYLSIINNDYLAVTAARVTVAGQSQSLDLVCSPRMTPSRIPLLNQRWFVLPAAAQNLPLQDGGARFPGGPQFGARWNRLGRYFEYSFSFFQGFNNLPLLNTLAHANPSRVDVVRSYPKIRTFGADIAVPLHWLTLKAESAWFQSRSRQADEYLLYVVQLERQSGEWLFIGGYAGEHVTERRDVLSFDPSRGLARSLVARASLTIDTNRTLTFEAVARQNGKGFYAKAEYSHALGQHWRLTAAFVLIRGSEGDFLGQYRRNSFAEPAMRYSF
jgi:hypothetical protein